MKKSESSEYENFDRTMRKLIAVPHSEIKAKLDAEKQAKKRRRKRVSRASGASSRDSGD
jgi:hypothetical protein